MADPKQYAKLYQACKHLQARTFADQVVLDELFRVDVKEAIFSYEKLRKSWNAMRNQRYERKDQVEAEQLESDGKTYLLARWACADQGIYDKLLDPDRGV